MLGGGNASFRTMVSAALVDQESFLERKKKPYFDKDQLLALVLSKDLIELVKAFADSLTPQSTPSSENRENRMVLTRVIY